MRWFAFLLITGSLAADAQWRDLFPKGSMAEWETVGDGLWKMRGDGVLVGMRDPKAARHQSWLYTRQEFNEFDLQLEYWLKLGENSGVSIRDKTRAAFACGDAHVPEKTPSHNGYEIQLANGISGREKYPSGSIYLFQAATGVEQDNLNWNTLEIRSRNDRITVLINGMKVAEHAGDPARPKDGPIGLQLHDPRTLVMFRNVRIRERP